MPLLHPARVTVLRDIPSKKAGPVVLWMSRDQRARDNWALIRAWEAARERGTSLVAAFCLAPGFLGATARHYDFLFKGLQEVQKELEALSIPLSLSMGEPGETLPALCRDLDASLVVTDFDPLRPKRRWKKEAATALDVSLEEVDAHNIVPAREVSDKQEYAARTIRPKIHRLLDEYLEDFPGLSPVDWAVAPRVPDPDFDRAWAFVDPDESVPPVDWIDPGQVAAEKGLNDFLDNRLSGYAEARNDPNRKAQSGLSPWLHFGHLAPQRAALEASKRGSGEDVEDFLEELVVRRELSDNYCLHNPDYDSFAGLPDWAKKTLNAHRDDSREYLYSPEEFEGARTHSALWNAAQMEMVETGKMHGYMRMYWAKKILQWSPSPEEAIATAIRLNDRYELDGRDPNGCVGVLWSMGGLHDRPWKEREVFGQVRYMNERGCRRKFDVDEYVRRNLGHPSGKG